MEAKLKLISRRIPWSLLAKAGTFGIAWFMLPWWLFFLLACYLYFSPSFQSVKLLLPFVLIIVAGIFLAHTSIHAAFMAVLFFLLAGIKEFFFIRRVEAYEALLFLLFFLFFLIFFGTVGEWRRASVFLSSVALGILFFFAAKSLLNFSEAKIALRRKTIFLGLLSFLMWQMSWALLFLPLAFFHQAAVLFLIAVFFVEFLMDYVHGRLRWEKLTLRSGIFLLMTGVIFWITEWGL